MDEVPSKPVGDPRNALEHSSKAVFDALNPEKKIKLRKDEVLEHLKKFEGKGDEGESVKHFGEAAKKALRNKHVKKIIEKVIRRKDGKSLKESDMVTLNERFMAGHLPRTRKGLGGPSSSEDEKASEDEDETDSEEKRKSEKNGMLLQLLDYSIKSALTVKNYMEKVVSKAGMSWLMTVLPVGQITTLVTFVLFSYVITAPFLSWFIPLSVLAFSLGLMVVSTMRIVRGVKRFAEFKAWAEFLDVVGSTQPLAIDTVQAEENYILNHVSPYIQFLISCCFCVMSHSVVDKAWVLNAELGLLSLMMFGAIVVIHDMYKCKASISIYACQFVATILEGFHRMEASGVYGQLFGLDLPFIGVTINVSIPAALRVWMLVQIFALLRKKCYKNVSVKLVKEVLPHVIAAAWWEVAVMFLGICSLHSIIRASAECVALLFAMPLMFVVSILAVLKFVFSLEFTKILLLTALVAGPLLYFKVWKTKEDFLAMLGKLKAARALKPVLKLLALIGFASMVFFYRPAGLAVYDSGLTWNAYKSVCFSSTDAHPTAAVTTLVCNEFNNYVVDWGGTAEDVKIVSITNEVERFVNVLPHSAATWLSCQYGSAYPTADECEDPGVMQNGGKIQAALCSLLPHAKRSCHLQKFNVYKFEIHISMLPDNSEAQDSVAQIIRLEASHDFRKVLLALEAGSPIRFRGVIKSRGLVSVKALFTKNDDDALTRHTKRRKRIENRLEAMMDDAFNSLCRFIFYPIVAFPEFEEE